MPDDEHGREQGGPSNRTTRRGRCRGSARSSRGRRRQGSGASGAWRTIRSSPSRASRQAAGSTPTGLASWRNCSQPRCPARRPDRSAGRSTLRQPTARPITSPIRGRQPEAASRPSGSSTTASSAHGTRNADPCRRTRPPTRRRLRQRPGRGSRSAIPLPTKNIATASINQPIACCGRAEAIRTPGATQTRVRSKGFHGTGSSAPAASAAARAVPRIATTPAAHAIRAAGLPSRTADHMRSVWGAWAAVGPGSIRTGSSPGRGREADQPHAEPGEPDRQEQVRLEDAVRGEQEVPQQEHDDGRARRPGKSPDRQAAIISSRMPKNDPTR